MARKKIPDHLMTREQKMRRSRNEKYRHKNSDPYQINSELNIKKNVSIKSPCLKQKISDHEDLSCHEIGNLKKALKTVQLSEGKVIKFPSQYVSLIETLNSESNLNLKKDIFPHQEEASKIIELNKVNILNKNQRTLLQEWKSVLKILASPQGVTQSLAHIFTFVKFFVLVTLIFSIVALSVHISGDFFGDKGFETALGVLIGGGILSVLAKTTTNLWQAVSFRFLAYIGTAAFLMVAYSGMKNSSLKDSEGYLASQKTINRIEAEIATVSNNLSLLAPEYGKLREKEYERRDKLKLELAQEQSRLRSITPNTHQDIAVIGNFIARFILDVVVFALFEVFAAQFLSTRRRLKALS